MLAQDDDEKGRQFYAETVFPLLETRCFECHGGGEKLKGHFRITSREGLIRGGDYGSGIDTANPTESLVLEMVSYQDDEHQMPPKEKLSEAEIAVLTQWVEMGAPYDSSLEIKGEGTERRGFTLTDEDRDWWAYRALSGDAPPQVDDLDWSKNGIDSFVRAQLEREGLKPNPQAPPATLIRRLHYDLTGLPPTPAEVEAFVGACESDFDKAYSMLVEDLLARPQYGEKWARHWLDVVRYAESNGFERDNSKPHIWRYRDYVIDAFNNDKPYDQFLIEQLAGDEIAEPTMESLVATGYHRLMQWDDEPADRLQHVYDVLADNVQITSEVFLATSLGCARCHDHKADPISQKDFYSFMSFFHGVTHYQTAGTLMNWASPEEKSAFEEERKSQLDDLTRQRDEIKAQLTDYLTENNQMGAGKAKPVTFIDDSRGQGAVWAYTVSKPSDDWADVGYINKAWVKAAGGFGAGSHPKSKIHTKWDTKEIWMRANFGLKALPDSLSLEIYHDEDVEVYLNGTLIHQAKGFLKDYEVTPLPASAVDLLQTGKNVIAVHCRHGAGGQYIDLALRTSSAASSLSSILSGPSGKKIGKEIKSKTGADLAGAYQGVVADIAKWRRREQGIPLNVVTEKGPDPGPLNIHLRGSAHALGAEVSPGFPAVLSSADSDPLPASPAPVEYSGRVSSGRRLALAEWMVGGGKMLTARVMANRIWQHHFGRGIVPSSSDFGKLGEKPTHPELLDWLASQFIESDWDIKAMHRLMLHSRTYQLSSEPDSGNIASDPQNNNLWRFSMRRLTAEELRDTILAVSGKLNTELHGEWVYPPLPAEVLATASRPGKGWPVSKNEEDHYRRSLYVHVKRSLRHQMLADFDQADTDTACAVRFATTVPTQALTMLNSKFVNDQAALFAARMSEEGGSVRDQIAAGLALVFQREPQEEELDHLVELHDTLQRDIELSPEEALERLALLALNLNEFIYLD